MRHSCWHAKWLVWVMISALLIIVCAHTDAEAVSAPREKNRLATDKNQIKKNKNSARKVSGRTTQKAVAQRAGSSRMKRTAYRSSHSSMSYGQQLGLHKIDDPLELKSSVALVLDQDTGQVLYEKNAHAVLPIASITKLMTALIVVEAGLNLEETLEITQADQDIEKGTGSRLKFGTKLSRAEALHLALMSSENRAASALGRNYPGGLNAFIQAMNAKAQLLGMNESFYADPTGLSSRNKSSAHDLARLMRHAYQYRLIREYSTSAGYTFLLDGRYQDFMNTNRLIQHADWSIGLQKTGFISEAGQCLVMQAIINERPTIMVFLDAQGRYSRFGDANRIKHWLMTQRPVRLKSVSLSEKLALGHGDL
jgi:D-alanyl-D-alanine endopeptidase (penicillin-binding protein 7)